jgi:hypothetical protein
MVVGFGDNEVKGTAIDRGSGLRWIAWGVVVAGLLLLLEGNVWTASVWVLFGVLIGWLGPKEYRLLERPLVDWYGSLNPNRGQIERRMSEIKGKWPFDVDEVDRRMMEDEEYLRLLAEGHCWIVLAVPPLFGLMYGPLVGPVLGVLFALDRSLGISPSAGAWIGLLMGPIVVTFVAARTLACVVEVDRTVSFLSRVARRAPLIGSPFLFVPFLWHCLLLIRSRWRSGLTRHDRN